MSTTTWERIAKDISARILSGETPVGSKIPSQKQLAIRHGASVGSAKRALQHLTDAGILEGRQGAGVFVLTAPTPTGPSLEERVAALERRLEAHEARDHPKT